MNKLKINKTFELIERLRPMIKHQDLDEYEENCDLEIFDVIFRQKDDLKTMWGDPKMIWEKTDLRSLMNNIYDYLADGYEMWIRETPQLENDPSKISDEWIRYAISLQAYNFDDDMIPLDCRMVSGWLVISLDFDATFDDEKRFFDEFGYEEHYMLGPTLEDVTGYLMDFEIMDLTHDKIKEFRIKRSMHYKIKCKHCEEQIKSLLERLKACDENYRESVEEKGNILRAIFKKMQQKYYICNICEGTFCSDKLLFNRVCIECRNNISNKIFKEKGYEYRFV